jgi:hypothetical protein
MFYRCKSKQKYHSRKIFHEKNALFNEKSVPLCKDLLNILLKRYDKVVCARPSVPLW